MGLFTPKWMKDTKTAEEVVRFSVDYDKLKTLYRMALKSPFPEYRAKAIRGLKECAYYDETTQYLQKLITEGVTAHDRCLAAALFGDKKVRQIVFQKDLAEANREKPEPEWFARIHEPSLMVQIYPEVSKAEKQEIISKLTDLSYVFAIAELESSEELLTQIVKKLLRDRKQLNEAVVKTKNIAFLTAALSCMDEPDLPVLARLAKLVQNGVIKRSLTEVAQKLSAEPELFTETLQTAPGNDFLLAALPYVQECDFPILAAFLEDNARKELWQRIARKLVYQAPHYYGDQCYNKLSEDEKLYAIQNRLVSKKTILKVAKDWRYSSPLCREALHHISDPSDAVALMQVGYISRSATPGELKNYAYLAGVAAKDPEKLTDFLLDKPAAIQVNAIPVVVGALDDQNSLARLALSGNTFFSYEAAKKLLPLRCKELRHKLSGNARFAATDNYFSYALAYPPALRNMKQEELLEGFRWARKKSKDTLAQNVIPYLRGEARSEALKDEILTGDRWNTVVDSLLAGIEDGDLLIPLVFYSSCIEQIICRIRELTATDPALEKRFTDTVVQKLSDNLGYADRLAIYYQISAPEAIWRYAGNTFIQMLLTIMSKKEEEPYGGISPVRAAGCLGEIYRNVSESRTALSLHRGKAHHVHYDYPDPTCGSEHVDHTQTFDTNW